MSSVSETQVGVSLGESALTVNTRGLSARELNRLVREAVKKGCREIVLANVTGQRYIAAGLQDDIRVEVFGIPGNDLGAFMDGPRIVVHGNGQDGLGNTMGGGEIVVHGDVGDITGMSARGGKIFVRGDVGYRTGVHMKEYKGVRPAVVIGGTAQDFLGEYMAGGVVLLLGRNLRGEVHNADFVGTGMHGGVIFVRGEFRGVGREVEVAPLDQEDNRLVEGLVKEFAAHFDCKVDEVLGGRFRKLIPVSSRPYGDLYAP